MLRKTIIVCALLLCALVAGTWAQGGTVFTGKVTGASTQVVDGTFEIVLQLAEYPNHAFYIGLEDAPKFGLTGDREIKSGAEFSQFTSNLEALKGKTVKLSCLKLEDSGAPVYRVKALERVSGK
ncbi:MAG: hypothetical protein A2Y80_01720 [Deltaproteobacteria bacterium RBG_13_58_19]|nr:MAG: hypothetical protein A2Y80_01720 [Deltaproteobacteria bacterium RBG_13_58_19]